MTDITGPPVTLDGTAIQGAEITVIETDTGAVLGGTTTDASGNWTITVSGGQTVHVLAEYEDSEGTLYQETSKPFVAVEASAPAFWSEALHRYEFTEGSGSTVADTGAAASPADLSLIGATWTTDAVHEGWAGDFDGTDDYGEAANRTTMSGFTDFTWLMWIKIPSTVTTRIGVAGLYETGTNDRAWRIDHFSSNTFRLYYSDDGAGYSVDEWSFSNYDEWVRLGVRFVGGNRAEFCVNGTTSAPSWTYNPNRTSIYQSAASFLLATRDGAPEELPCNIDDCMLWNRALTDQELLDDYNAYTVPA